MEVISRISKNDDVLVLLEVGLARSLGAGSVGAWEAALETVRGCRSVMGTAVASAGS